MACRVAERDRTAHWADLLATILLSVAAVATAWATYQAAHWRSEQGLAGNRTRLRTTGSRIFVLGMGWLLFSSALLWMITFPLSLSR